jgi:proteasome assembly chaperone (PAC2) family protein
MKLVTMVAKPKLNSPILLAAWPGISNVAIIAAGYLLRKLDFKPLAEVDAPHFFDPIGVLVKDSLVESPQFPQSRFYYWKNEPGLKDIILFIGEDQPGSKGYEMTNLILDLGQKFQTRRIYTFAAALTRIHHSEKPRVWAATTTPDASAELAAHELVMGGNLQISGLNGLLLGVAKERNTEGVCLLGEVPSYASRIANPTAALAVINTFSHIEGIKVDVAELEQQAVEARQRMSQVAAEAMGEYIDYFTEPIWESGEDGEDEEDEDER